MQAVKDKALWQEYWLDMPMMTPVDAKSPDDAMQTPGCYLKSTVCRNAPPENFGRLAKFTDNEVVVISSPLMGEIQECEVWIYKTTASYFCAWDCD